jgi:hypothetical protein
MRILENLTDNVLGKEMKENQEKETTEHRQFYKDPGSESRVSILNTNPTNVHSFFFQKGRILVR